VAVIRRLLAFIEAPSRLRYALGEIEYLRARISEVTAERDRARAQASALRIEVEQLRETPCE
jgi:hypothetical protein